MRAAGQDLPLPEIDGGEYLIEALGAEGALGWATTDGMGNILPLPWSEISAFSTVTEVIAEPWEAQQLRAMSQAYVAGLRLGRDPLAVAPMDEGKANAKQAAMAKAMRARIRGRKSAR